MSPDVEFDPPALDRAGEGLTEAAAELVNRTQTLLGSVSDVSALGTNDTLGSVASALYAAVLDRLQETVQAVQEEYGGHGDKLRSAAAAYRETEQANADAGSTMVSEA